MTFTVAKKAFEVVAVRYSMLYMNFTERSIGIRHQILKRHKGQTRLFSNHCRMQYE